MVPDATARSWTGSAPSSPTAGPLRPAEIEHDAKEGARGPWWDWDVVKHALEYLWLFGEVAIAGRRGFERRYALAEQVHPRTGARVTRRARRCDPRARSGVRPGRTASATASDLADYWRIEGSAARS